MNEKPPLRVTVGVARLSSENEPILRDTGSAVHEFKDELLWKAVMDEPWDTALAWADALALHPELDSAGLDRMVASAAVELFDLGLAYFFEFQDFGDSYRRTPAEADRLSRDALLSALESGSDIESTEPGTITAPCLGIRATEHGRQRVFHLWPEDRERWERFQASFKAEDDPKHD